MGGMIRVGRGLYYRSMGSDMCGEVTHSWGGCPDRSLDLVSVPIGKVVSEMSGSQHSYSYSTTVRRWSVLRYI